MSNKDQRNNKNHEVRVLIFHMTQINNDNDNMLILII